MFRSGKTLEDCDRPMSQPFDILKEVAVNCFDTKGLNEWGRVTGYLKSKV